MIITYAYVIIKSKQQQKKANFVFVRFFDINAVRINWLTEV